MTKKLIVCSSALSAFCFLHAAQPALDDMLTVLKATQAQIPAKFVGTTYGSGSAGFKKLVENLETAIKEERTEHESALKSTTKEPAIKEEDFSAATKRAQDAETAHQQTQAELAAIKEKHEHVQAATEKLMQEKQTVEEELATAKLAQQTCEKELDEAKVKLATETLKQLTEQVKAKKVDPKPFTAQAEEFVDAMRSTIEPDFAKK